MATGLLVVMILIFLEIALSFDNALAIAALVSRLPKPLRNKALTYGVWGATGFRIVALFFLQQITKYVWIRMVGALYLLYLSFCHFFFAPKENDSSKIMTRTNFWRIVFAVEMTDIIFSADSILASMTVTNNYLIMVVGGCIGILAMRFASGFFASLMAVFPKLEDAAFVLVGAAGMRLMFEWAFSISIPEPVFYAVLMVCIGYGFTKKLKRTKA